MQMQKIVMYQTNKSVWFTTANYFNQCQYDKELHIQRFLLTEATIDAIHTLLEMAKDDDNIDEFIEIVVWELDNDPLTQYQN